MDKKHCEGCHLDAYNRGQHGADACWYRGEATLVWRKQVRVDEAPPYRQKPHRFPDCYRMPGYAFVSPEVTR